MLHGFDFLRQQYSQLAKPAGGQQSAVNTVQTLADRLTQADQSQASVEDRRAAVLALKGLSRDHTRIVGEKGLPALLLSLQRDVKDEETARALVECCITLCEVPVPVPAPDAQKPFSRKKQQDSGTPVGLLNTDIFLAEPGPLHALLPLLAPHRAFYTRFASLQLLGSLLRNRPLRVQDHVLVAPGGCGAILECLAEGAGSSAEIVRNEALLLLPHLVHANADIQKLVAFEGAFEKLLDVCAAEGRIEGGVIVQDALEGLESLLRYNVSNQNYFRETLSIPMLAPLLFYPPAPPAGQTNAYAEQEYARQLEAFSFQEWDQQKLINAKLVIGIAAMLVGGQGDGRRANQNALLQCGFTKCLIQLSLASTAPGSLKAQALHVLAQLLKASRANQDQLSQLTISPVQIIFPEPPLPPTDEPTDDPAAAATAAAAAAEQALPAEPTFTKLPPRPAVVALIGTAANGSAGKGGLGLRAAALACFSEYVADNLDARIGIISTMAAPPQDNLNEENPADSPFSAGSLLVDGLIQNPATQAGPQANDAYKYLFCSIMMAHLVRGSETAKKAAREIAITPEGAIVKRALKEEEQANDNEEEEDDDGQTSLIQAIVGNLTMAEKELADAVRRERSGPSSASASSSSFSAADWTRIMTGYLVVLSIWLFDSPLSVRDFLSESATLQALIQPVAQSSGVDPLIQGLAAFLLGVAYEFDTNPGQVAVTRATMHPILLSRIGADQFAVRLDRIKDDSRFFEVGPDVLERLIRVEEDKEAEELRAKELAEAAAAAAAAAATAAAGPGQQGDAQAAAKKDKEDEEARDRDMEVSGLGHLSRRRRMGFWFDWTFVEFWKSNSVLIQKTILVDPASSSSTEAAASTELLDAQRQLEQMRDNVAKQTREIEVLEKKLEETNATADKDRSDLTKRLEEAEAAKSESVSRITVLEGEIASLKQSHADAVAELERKAAALDEQLEQTSQREQDSSAKVLELTRALGDAKSRSASDKDKDKKDKEVPATVSVDAEKVSALEAEVESAKADAVKAREEADALKTRIDELEKEKEQLTKQLAEAESLRDAQAKDGAGVAQKEVEAARKEKEDAEKKAADAESKASEAEKKVSAAEARAVEAEKKAANVEKKVTDAQSKATEADKKVKEAETKAAEAEKKVKDAEKKAADADKKIKDIEKKATDAEKKVEDAEKKVKDAEKKATDAEKKVKDAEKKANDAEKKIKEAEKKAADADKKAKEAEKKAADAEKKVADAGSSNDKGTELTAALKEKEELSKENEDLLVLLEELSQKRKRDKAAMKEKGLDVSEDEDEDDDDDEDVD